MISSRPVILVVDDNPDNLALASALLKHQYKVKLATNGEKAIEIARADPPDLILLDVMMPGIDGYETCAWLKSDATLKQIPIIFLTALGEDEDAEKGFALGAVDYVVKPFTPALLLARVKTHLTLKHVQGRSQRPQYLSGRRNYQTHRRSNPVAGSCHNSHGISGRNEGSRNWRTYPAHFPLRPGVGHAAAA